MNSQSFRRVCRGGFLAAACLLTGLLRASDTPPLRERLKELPFKIAYETYTNDNWEIFVMNPDGSNPVNLTQTPKVHEHYPQISPQGDKMCFVADEGEGREAVRTLYVMDIDGRNRKKIADHAREPFWSPDGKIIGFLPQQYAKFNVIDYYTEGMSFYDLASGEITPHVNTTNIHHLYNPSWSQNGKWIAATTHATVKYGHAILLIEARGDRIINLHIPGCRPCLSPDGKQIAWGAGDHEIAAAPIDLDADEPKVGEWRVHIKDETNKIYHVDWSPDSRFLSISRGPDGEGDETKPGCFGAACEIMGVIAPGWNLFAVSAERSGTLDINQAGEQDFQTLTSNGLSNKEPAWFRAGPKPKP